MPDSTLSLAIQEAYASAPAAIIYHTLEINHAAFTAPIRVVRDNATLTARLEAGAPHDAGALVDFVGYPFEIVPPETTHTAVPQCTIEIDNVSRDILAQIDATLGSTELITVIYRAFLQGNLDIGPENDPPLAMTIMSISANVFRIKATAGFSDLGNRRFPGEEYTSERFPGLIAQ
jgi:hypothetical protein